LSVQLGSLHAEEGRRAAPFADLSGGLTAHLCDFKSIRLVPAAPSKAKAYGICHHALLAKVKGCCDHGLYLILVCYKATW
jgi:hypothetical protein